MTATTTSEAPRPVGDSSATTRRLLACGVVAGPLFVTLVAVQVLTRDTFDLSLHPISALSLGELGWVQIANFVVTGLLTIAFAAGVRRALQHGRAATAGPLLVGAYGVGLIAAGVFVADPAFGFPAGAPEGRPAHLSWHAIVHGIAAGLALLSLTAACFVFARRFAALRRGGWVAYCAATGVATLALSPLAGEEGISLRLAIAVVITWAWTTAMAGWLRTELAGSPPSNPAASAEPTTSRTADMANAIKEIP